MKADELVVDDPVTVLRDFVKSCTRCHLHAHRNGPVPYRGSLRPLILAVGEAPGDDEDSSGEPFVGKAGKYLMYALIEAGVKLNRVGYINTVNCHPGRKKGGGFRPPAYEERVACGTNLDMTIAMTQPRLLLLLGGTAIKAFRPDMEVVKAARGRPFTRDGLMCVPTYHPAAALRAHGLKENFELDVKQAYWRSKRVGKESGEGGPAEFERWPTDCWLCDRDGEFYDPDGVVYCDFHKRTRGFVEDGTMVPQTLEV